MRILPVTAAIFALAICASATARSPASMKTRVPLEDRADLSLQGAMNAPLLRKQSSKITPAKTKASSSLRLPVKAVAPVAKKSTPASLRKTKQLAAHANSPGPTPNEIPTTAAVSTVSLQANASTVAIISGQCDSLTDGDSAGCSFTGNINTNTNGNSSFLLAQGAYNAMFDPDIMLNPLFSVDSSEFLVGGTEYIANENGSFTFNLPDNLDLDYFAIKGGNDFTLFQYIGGLDNMFTFTRSDLSHAVFFGTATPPVPEPGTWAMMLLGFGAIGFSLRRRKEARSHNGTGAASYITGNHKTRGPCLSMSENVLTND